MEAQVHRCPDCGALVVDRRSPVCTTCHAKLPAGWVMSEEQIAKVLEFDAHARAEHALVMAELDPTNDPAMSETVPEPDANLL